MKAFISLVFLVLVTNVAPAAPYIVYSGSIVGSNLSSSGSTNSDTVVYLVTDIADTSNFAVLLVSPSTKVFSVISWPTDSPTTEEANNNFLGSAGTGKAARAILCYSNEVTDSNNNTTVVRAYGTGVLTTKNTVLVAARRIPVVVGLKTNRVAEGTYTFSTLSPALTSGDVPFAPEITGTALGYVIDSASSLANATTPGVLSLKINPTLTEIANIGGGYEVNPTTVAAIMPFTVPSGESVGDAYSAWLTAFAQACGYTSASSSVSGFTAASSSSAMTLTQSGSFAGTGLVTVGAGTLKLAGTGNTLGTVTITNSSVANGFNGVLTLGGAITVNNSSGTTVTQNDPTGINGTATLTLNIGTGSTLVTGTIATGTLTTGSGFPTGASLSLVFTNATLTVGAINNGVVNGMIVNQVSTGFTVNFTGATVSVNGVTNVSNLSPAQTLTGTFDITGATLTNNAGVVSSTGGTITVTTQ